MMPNIKKQEKRQQNKHYSIVIRYQSKCWIKHKYWKRIHSWCIISVLFLLRVKISAIFLSHAHLSFLVSLLLFLKGATCKLSVMAFLYLSIKSLQ